MRGAAKTQILIIGSIVLLIVAIVAVTALGGQVWNKIRHGKCWGDFMNDVDYFYNSYSKPSLFAPQFKGSKELTFGDCVGALAFINADDFKDLKEDFQSRGLNCKGGTAYIVGIPYYPDTESGWRFWLWPKDFLENIANTWNDRVKGMQPYCKALQGSFTGTAEPMLGPNKEGGSTEYCVTELLKEKDEQGKDQYSIQYSPGPCKEEE